MSTAQDLTIAIANSPEEKAGIYQFRYQIYSEEFGLDFGPSAKQSKQLIDHLDVTAQQYAAKTPNGDIVGTFRINRYDALANPLTDLAPLPIAALLEQAPAEAISYTSRVMVRADWRGSTALAKLAQRFIGDLLDMGIRIDTCFSSLGLIAFFEQLGYRRYSKGVVLEKLRYSLPMLLVLNDLSHLRSVRSPLSRHSGIQHRLDSWGDASWAALQTEGLSTNHRLMDVPEFWSIVSDALFKPSNNTALLHGLSEEQAHRLVSVAPLLELTAGEQLITRGIRCEDLFVVIKGNLEANWGDEHSQAQTTISLQPGAVFGEAEFLAPKPSEWNVIARSNASVLILNQVFLQKGLQNHPTAMALMLRNLGTIVSERLTDANRRLASATGTPAQTAKPMQQDGLTC